MPDATITSTASTFGTISGTFAADQSTITGTITGVVSGTLTGSVGVPGPQGPAGPGSTWGGIVGTLSAQTDLWTELGTKYLASNPAGYQTAAQVSTALSPYITSATATASFYPLTGNPSAFLQAAALSPYLLSSTASATYQTQAAMSAYLTTSAAAAGYYPLSGNPSGFLTAASLSGYATESWVTGQGYITSAALSPYLLSSTAASTYQTQSAMSAYLTKADNLASVASTSAARSNLGLGSLDTPTFAGITAQGSGANVANLTPTSLSLNHATSGSFTIQPSVGIVFPDGSTQTTAFTGSAPGYITSVSSPLSVSAGNLSIDLSAYLTSATAASVYQTQVGMSSYLTTASASATYYPLTNPSGYITSSALTGYATQAWVDAQGYLQAGALTGYALESWVTSQGYLTDAPSDGNQYARKNGAWDVVSSTSPYITSVSSPLSVTSGDLTIDLSAYALLSGATFTGAVFAPTPSPGTNSTRIATTEWVKDFDYAPTNSPHFTGNPQSVTPNLWDDDTSIATTAFVKGQNYITSSALSGYATESWVTSQGYLTSAALTGYATESWVTAGFYPLSGNPSGFITSAALSPYLLSSTAASTYQTLAGMSSYLTTSAAATNYVARSGSSMTGGLTMGAGGYIGTFQMLSGDSITIPDGGTEIYETVLQNKGLLVRDASNVPLARFQADLVLIPSVGITFSDASVQTSAGITASAAASTYQTIAGMSSYATLASPDLTGNVTITSNSSGAALFIEQAGTGNILTLHDQASDTSFVAIDQNGKVNTIASTTTNAGLNIGHGTAPSAPVNGDVWTTTTGLFYRINGATVSPATLAGGTFTGPIITAASTTTAAGLRIPVGTAPTTPVAGDVWSSSGANGTLNFRSSGGTTQAVAALGLTQTFTGNNTFSGATLNFGNATTATTIGLGNGATATATTKTVNVGTAGTSGSTTTVNVGSSVSGATSTINLNGTVNAAGLANGVKAWVNFNGTGTVAIRASYNVSSITDNGVADYTVNFTTAISDANYMTQSTSEWIVGNNGQWAGGLQLHPTVAPTTTAVRLQQTAIADFTYCNVVIVR